MNKAPNVNFLHFTTTDPIYCVTCINVVHNWLEMQKVVTFPLFLMEHPVFIMYIQVMYMRKGKKKKKFFLDMLGSEPAATSITNFGEFSVLYSGLKSTKKSTCIKVPPYVLVLPFYISIFVRTKHLHQKNLV